MEVSTIRRKGYNSLLSYRLDFDGNSLSESLLVLELLAITTLAGFEYWRRNDHGSHVRRGDMPLPAALSFANVDEHRANSTRRQANPSPLTMSDTRDCQ